MRPSSAPPPGCAGKFSGPYMVKLGPQIIVFCVYREHVQWIINLLSSLGRSGSHATIILLCGDVSSASVARLFADEPAGFVVKQTCFAVSYAVLSRSVMSNSLWPHGLQPARLLCPWGFTRQECGAGGACRQPGPGFQFPMKWWDSPPPSGNLEPANQYAPSKKQRES